MYTDDGHVWFITEVGGKVIPIAVCITCQILKERKDDSAPSPQEILGGNVKEVGRFWMLSDDERKEPKMKMKVESIERGTRMGAVQFTAVLFDGKFIRVSDLPEARMKGTDRGYTTYEVTVPRGTITAKFFRSNRGNETVYCNGERFNSFAAAQEWTAVKCAA